MNPFLRACTILLPAFFLASAPATARAEIKYYSDPVYKQINDDDPHPMDDMLALAKEGDVRAQFILGDMYSKGKGGFAKDIAEARRWFEAAAMHGDNYSFIRLAALAKRDNKPTEAWQWYELAIEGFGFGKEREFVIKARRDLTDTAKLPPEEIESARKAIREWKALRSKQLQLEKEAQRLRKAQKELADLEKVVMEQREKKNTGEMKNDQD